MKTGIDTKIENREKPKAVSILFMLFIFAGLAFCILTPDRDFSENENRPLAEFPELSVQALADGSFMEKFESYAADQMAGRDFWMAATGFIRKAAGNSDNGKVYFGKDGYLFSTDEIDDRQLEKNTGYVLQFFDKIRKQNPDTRLSVLVAPTAAWVEKAMLPEHLNLADQKKIIGELQAKFGDDFCNVVPELESHSDEYIYFKTDHHWTALGAWYAYGLWSKENGFGSKNLADYKEKTLSKDFCGTNFSKAGFAPKPDILTAMIPQKEEKLVMLAGSSPDELKKDIEVLERTGFDLEKADGKLSATVVSDSIIDESYLDKKDKYSCFLSGNNPITVVKKTKKNNGEGAGNGRKLLLVKDSYSHCMMPLLAGDFDEIIAVDLRYYKGSTAKIAKEYDVTDVMLLYNIMQFANERNIVYLLQ